MSQPVPWRARIVSLLLGGLLGGFICGLVVAIFVGFAFFLLAGGGWATPLGIAIAYFASWPTSRFVVPSPTPHDGLRLALLGLAQWTGIGFLCGAVFGRLLLAMVRYARGAANEER